MNNVANTTEMTSFQIKREIERMVSLYRDAVNKELDEMEKDFNERGTEEGLLLDLSRLVSSNESRWSGGNSVSNMAEQITREAASERLSKLLLKNAYTKNGQL